MASTGKPSLSLRLIAIIVIIIAVILPFIVILLFPFAKSLSMIDYKGVSVESLSDEQMASLVGLKFVQNEQGDLDKSKMITRDRLPENSRVIPPGHVVTMDWDPKRLNVHLDNEGIIKKVKKG